MKKLIYIFVLLLVSCQKDELTETYDDSKSTNINSKFYQYALRMSQEETSSDNIIDNTNCFRVLLPVTVIVNGQQINITNTNDYQLVQNAINQFNNDDDIVNFIFPIRVKLRNSTEIVVNSKTQLDQVIDDNDNYSDFSEIKCLKFKYPFTVSVYNKSTKNYNSYVCNNNIQCYNYFASLTNNDLFELFFPFSLLDNNNQVVTFNNLSALETYIEDNSNSCNQVTQQTALNQAIVSGIWKISYFTKNNNDRTSEFIGYTFIYNINGTSTATKTGVVTNGNWSTSTSSSNLKWDINFNNNIFNDINKNWKVIDFNTSQIRLKSSNSSNPDYLFFNKN